MPTCFVIMGYGVKKDFLHNRDIDLDKTFRTIIKPSFAAMGYDCKRSCDFQLGLIDGMMYEGIYNSDFVLADISTLNPNAIYELGVRHSLKPHSTLIICEDGILTDGKLPFDLNHISVLPFKHGGNYIDAEEAVRMQDRLKEEVAKMKANLRNDSPVFQFLNGLEVNVKKSDSPDNAAKPEFVKLNIGGAAGGLPAAPPVNTGASATPELTLSDMIDIALNQMRTRDFKSAIDSFTKLSSFKPSDAFFIQQLSLATYKNGQPDPVTANKAAYTILEKLHPMTSLDTETLGMAGATHKNLFYLTGDKSWLEKSLRFYERGYYIANDYYNGINTAFLYWQMAAVAANKEEALFYKTQALQIDKRVVDICSALAQADGYNKRNDKEWIVNTLAEAYFGLDDTTNFNQIIKDRQKEQTDFSNDSFMLQFTELKKIKEKVALLLQ
jgi:hypothetical protein